MSFIRGFEIGFMSNMLSRMFGGWMFPCCGFHWHGFGCGYMVPYMNCSLFMPYSTPMMTMPGFDTVDIRLKDLNKAATDSSYFSYQSFLNPDYTSNLKVELPKIDFNALKNPNRGGFPDFRFSNDKSKDNKPAGVSSASAGKTWDKMTDSEMKSVYGEYTKDITTLYRGTAADLNKYLSGKGVLENKGQAFIDAQNKYGISASALAAICMNESGEGKSELARTKNNVGGVRISGSTEFRSYNSVEECIDHMAQFLKSGYANSGLTKLYQVNAKYCPASDTTDTKGINSYWARNVDRYLGDIERVLA